LITVATLYKEWN